MNRFINEKMKPFRIKVPLFWKFSIAIITIVFIFGSINSILIYNNVQSSLQNETLKRALFVAKTISREITESILFEDFISLQNNINSFMDIDEGIFYIFVLDNQKNVLVHTFENNFPTSLLSLNELKENQAYNIQLLKIKDLNDELILDVVVPILEGRIGVVRVGLYVNTIISDVQKTINIFWIMVALFLTVGIIGAFSFARFITEPIKAIQGVTDKIDLSQIGRQEIPTISIRKKFLGKIKLLFRAEDEIDILADRFNQMIRRLENAYNELQKAQKYLLQSEKLATVGTLTAGLVHEINNPIAGIQNCIRRIKANPTNLEQNKKYFELMENAINRIEVVVTNLLNFSRKSSSDFTEIHIDRIIENALLLVGHQLEKHRITVTNNLNKNLPSIMGNKNELEQVFVNLFINAIDAIEENCKISPNCQRRLIINSSFNDSEIEIEVIDSGKGISKENLDKIFDPFFTTKEVGKGTGLGLSIVYNIISSHNGKIKIESEDGKGTKVILNLPIKKLDVP